MLSPFRIDGSFSAVERIQSYLGVNNTEVLCVDDHYIIKTDKQTVELYIGDVVQIVDGIIIICCRGR